MLSDFLLEFLFLKARVLVLGVTPVFASWRNASAGIICGRYTRGDELSDFDKHDL